MVNSVGHLPRTMEAAGSNPSVCSLHVEIFNFSIYTNSSEGHIKSQVAYFVKFG